MVFCKILTKNVVFIKKDDDKGFTLIELIVVLSLMTVLSALVYPQFSRFQNKLALKQAANQLAADIRYIKQKTIANEGTSDTYITLVDDEHSPGNYYNITIKSNSKQIDFKEIYGNKVAIKVIAFAGNKIQFNYFGNLAGASGHVLLQSKDGEKMYVIVHNVLGRVRVDTQDPQGNY